MTSERLPEGAEPDHDREALLAPRPRAPPTSHALTALRALIESAPAGLALFDRELRYVHLNDQLARMHGLPVEATLGRTISEVIPAIAAPVEQRIRAVLEAGEPQLDVMVSGELPHGAGGVRHFVANYYPVPLGGLTGVGVIVIDVTEHFRATERITRLQDVTAGLASAATSAEVADVVLHQGLAAVGAAAGMIVHASDGGSSVELISACGFPDAVVSGWRRFSVAADTPLGEAVRTASPVFLETHAERRTLYSVPCEMNGAHRAWVCLPLIAHGRAIGGWALSFTTERTFAADERSFMLAMARLCAQALERARLFEAAEVANRANEQFLAVLSHELRTPLTAILGWLQILRARGHDPALLERALRIMDRNARSEVRLIDDILDVSRIAADKLALSMRAVDVNVVTRAAMDLVAPAVEDKGLALEAALDPAPIIVLGDAVRLQQAIGNLLSNALKFTAKGGRIRVESARVGAVARVRVRDTGEGIAPELLARVFEPFQQGDAGTTRRHGGLGIGLTIARHLIEQHGGTLTAQSAGVGRGTTFTVSLPAPAATEPDGRGSDPGSERRRLDATRTALLPGVRVLVVDDEPDNAELVGEILVREGACVALAGSCAEAMAILAAGPVDVLLCDISMPHEDGYTLLGKARALLASRGRPLRAAALTAHTGADDVARCLAAGFEAHLGKPIDAGLLVDTVADLAAKAARGA